MSNKLNSDEQFAIDAYGAAIIEFNRKIGVLEDQFPNVVAEIGFFFDPEADRRRRYQLRGVTKILYKRGVDELPEFRKEDGFNVSENRPKDL